MTRVRTSAVALVIPEPATRIFSDDPFFPNIVQGVSDELRPTMHHLVLTMANSPASRDHVRRYAQAGHLDGVMMLSMHGPDPLLAALQRMDIPVVAMERPLGRATAPIVGVDSVSGAQTAVQHLLDRGRERIATICGPQDMPAGIDRLLGFERALRGSCRQSAVAAGDFTRQSGERAMQQLLDDDPRLDAVFVASDLMAAGALAVLQREGKRVPEDIAVGGFDDNHIAETSHPKLTTIRQPYSRISAEMVRLLLSMIEGESPAAVIVPTELVVRASA